MYISDKQVKAMDMIGKIADTFGDDRWFTQSELPGITKHTMDALVYKQFLEHASPVHEGIVYYRRLKELMED